MAEPFRWRLNGRRWKVPDILERPALYKDNGFKEEERARELIAYLKEGEPLTAAVVSKEKKKETKKIRRFFTIWQSFRMTAQKCLRSARMKR